MAVATLRAGEVDERLIGDSFDETIAQHIERDSSRSNLLGVRHAFVDLRIGKSAIRTDGAVVNQRPPGDDLGSSGDRDLGVAEASVGTEVADSQLGHLACAARRRVLMALATGLSVVERSETIAD